MSNKEIKHNEAKTNAKRKYNEKTYKRVSLYIKNDEMNIIESFCKDNNYSKNNIFVEGAREKIERETGKTFGELLKENEELKENTKDTENTVNNPNNDV